MNGSDLIFNMVGELSACKDILIGLLEMGTIEENSEEAQLISDISADLDRYNNYAQSLDVLLEDMEVE